MENGKDKQSMCTYVCSEVLLSVYNYKKRVLPFLLCQFISNIKFMYFVSPNVHSPLLVNEMSEFIPYKQKILLLVVLASLLLVLSVFRYCTLASYVKGPESQVPALTLND